MKVVVGDKTFHELIAQGDGKVTGITVDGKFYPVMAEVDGRKISAERWSEALKEHADE